MGRLSSNLGGLESGIFLQVVRPPHAYLPLSTRWQDRDKVTKCHVPRAVEAWGEHGGPAPSKISLIRVSHANVPRL